jgi:hypothetical protein
VKYHFIEEHRDTHSVEMMAEALDVARSGYYKWQKQSLTKRKCEDLDLIDDIKRSN